jgi:hypothetical protein
MEQNEMMDIHKIIMSTLKVVPKAWDMNHQNFNCDCHMELTDKTYELIGERFNTISEEGKNIVDNYFMIVGGNV